MIRINDRITLEDSEIEERFVRASGPGGQNVNKVSSAVQLRFDLAGTAILDERAKARLRLLAGRRLTDDGSILIIARDQRTQEANRREALARLTELIRRALVEPKVRKATKPTRGSKERRLAEKKRRAEVKRARGGVEE
jgi:ribosome-associated protein